jgi:hypothetical protein
MLPVVSHNLKRLSGITFAAASCTGPQTAFKGYGSDQRRVKVASSLDLATRNQYDTPSPIPWGKLGHVEGGPLKNKPERAGKKSEKAALEPTHLHYGSVGLLMCIHLLSAQWIPGFRESVKTRGSVYRMHVCAWSRSAVLRGKSDGVGSPCW